MAAKTHGPRKLEGETSKTKASKPQSQFGPRTFKAADYPHRDFRGEVVKNGVKYRT